MSVFTDGVFMNFICGDRFLSFLGLKGKSGVIPARSRHCNRNVRAMFVATDLLGLGRL